MTMASLPRLVGPMTHVHHPARACSAPEANVPGRHRSAAAEDARVWTRNLRIDHWTSGLTSKTTSQRDRPVSRAPGGRRSRHREPVPAVPAGVPIAGGVEPPQCGDPIVGKGGHMTKRLVMCCDGTWNTAGQKCPTNVERMIRTIAPYDAQGMEQKAFYHAGVGTKRWERIRGGAFGFGLSHNVRDCYRFLVENYQPTDELFFLGFSRGAFTARSTAGFVRNAGILRREHILS